MTFQKWLLVISVILVSGSFAYYLLIYIPEAKRVEIRQRAGIECSKRRDEAIKTMPPAQTQEQTAAQAEIIIKLNSQEMIDRCIQKVLNEWGYNSQ